MEADDYMSDLLSNYDDCLKEGDRIREEIKRIKEENEKLAREKQDLQGVIHEHKQQLEELRKSNPEIANKEEELYDDGEGWPDAEGDEEDNQEALPDVVIPDELVEEEINEDKIMEVDEPKLDKEDPGSSRPEDDATHMLVTITFTVPEKYRTSPHLIVEVLGNFTSWCPNEMMRSNDDIYTFTYDVSLKRGFKHRYHFMVNGEDMVDETHKTMYNRFGSLSNFVSVPLKSQENNIVGDINKFISQDLNYIDDIDYPVFVSQESAALIKMRSSKETKELYSKIKQEILSSLENVDKLETERRQLEESLMYYDCDPKKIKKQLAEIKDEVEKIEYQISKVLRGRITHSLEDSPILYEIVGFD